MTLDKLECPRCKKIGYMFDYEKQCWGCNTLDKIKELGIEAVKDGQTIGEDWIVCPYCGYHFGEDDIHESTTLECYRCNKEFNVEVEYSVSYSTSKVKE